MTWVHTSGIKQSGNAGLPVFFGDSASLDAFARVRFSQPFTLFDSKQVWNDGDIADSAENFPLFWDNQEISGGSTTTLFNVNRASTTLGVAASTAGNRVRQSKQRFNYQPGKSQLVIITGIIGNTGSGITKRLGLYDDDDGLFFEDSEGTFNVVIRSSVGGSAVNTKVAQSAWNIDPMDGTGPSGEILDKTKAMIYMIDFEWLGVGRVRFGVYIAGRLFYVHEFLNSNTLGSVYMSTPNLPIRAEIDNDGSGGAATLEQICVTVVSEGGVQPNGALRFENIGAAAAVDITAAAIGSAYAICGIRLKSAYLSANVQEVFVSVIENSGANNPFLWQLHINPTLTSGLTYADVPNSAVQFGVGLAAGDVVTADGTVIGGGYQARTDANANVSLLSALRIGSLIDGTADELILSGTPLTNNQLYFGGMQWREAW